MPLSRGFACKELFEAKKNLDQLDEHHALSPNRGFS